MLHSYSIFPLSYFFFAVNWCFIMDGMERCQPRIVDVIIKSIDARRIHTHPCMCPYPLTRLLVPPRRFINASPISIRMMSVPKAIQDQIRQIIPPLNGKLHKGQSGTSPLDSPHALPPHTTQDVLEYSEVHLSAFLKWVTPINVVSNRTAAILEPHSLLRSLPNEWYVPHSRALLCIT